MDNWRWAGVPFYLRSGKKLGQSRQVITHQAMCYFAYLSGCRLVRQAARDPLFRAFLLGYMDPEAIPTLPPVPGVESLA